MRKFRLISTSRLDEFCLKLFLLFTYLGALVDWWKPETSEQFKEKAQCIIWQYGNYTHKQVGKKINGIITQGENIADNGGIKEAYLGYGKLTFYKL